MRACTVPRCNRRHKAKNYCMRHYLQWRRHGTPTPPPPPPVCIDEAAVERAVSGVLSPELNVVEREEVVRRLHARGVPDTRIAACLGMSHGGPRAIRRRLGLPAVVPPGRPVTR